jgi:hypothetical protein
MSLADVKVTHTTFSMFVEYSYIMGAPASSNFKESDPETKILRFDARMLHHFDYMVKLYCNLRRIFPRLIV